jgi:hypothetical protein
MNAKTINILDKYETRYPSLMRCVRANCAREAVTDAFDRYANKLADCNVNGQSKDLARESFARELSLMAGLAEPEAPGFEETNRIVQNVQKEWSA